MRSEIGVLSGAAEGPEEAAMECPMMVNQLWVLQADTHTHI